MMDLFGREASTAATLVCPDRCRGKVERDSAEQIRRQAANNMNTLREISSKVKIAVIAHIALGEKRGPALRATTRNNRVWFTMVEGFVGPKGSNP